MEKKNITKYVVLVGDGMADYPLEKLGGKTPLEVASTPNMDSIAACGIGLTRTIPPGMEPGSDVANLALLGYDPLKYHTGRGPLEAASMGVKLCPDEVAFRMNLVTLDMKSDGEIIMVSNTSGGISTSEAELIVDSLRSEMRFQGVSIYPGVAYRHLFVWDNGPENAKTIPPHDVLEQNMALYLNNSSNDRITQMIKSSWPILKEHPVNRERREKGREEANSIWIWGQGKAPNIPLFERKFGLRGGVISAVDLLKGIGIYAGFHPIHVEGATGYLDTNYVGKAEAAVESLKDLDFMFVHVEAPDEASHAGDVEEKIQAIENFDSKVVGNVLQGMKSFENYRVLVVSDHFTPIAKRTHTDDPTPFAWSEKKALNAETDGPGFNEKTAKESGLFFEKGEDLMPAFLDQV